jgi:hypothetical protein
MGAMRRRLRGTLAAAALGLAAGPAWSAGSMWTPAAREKMVSDALKVAPPALARMILKHPESLLSGLAEAALTEGTAAHREDGAGTKGGAGAALEALGSRAVAALDGHRPMSEVVRLLGAMAHLAADVNDPFLTSPRGGGTPIAPDYALYVEKNLRLFPVVFYGWTEAGGAAPEEGGLRDLGSAALASAARARGYFDHIERAYAAGGTGRTFDVRSVPFGVASICYSRAVTDIARAWTDVWRRAHGDFTGTPHVPGSPGPAAAGARGILAAAPAGRPAPSPPPPETAVPPPPAAAVEAPPDPAALDPPAITKTILGKSRKRLAKGGAPPSPDPNSSEPGHGTED